eukprot:16445253-Heterocapsa_arctica.AAC.1
MVAAAAAACCCALPARVLLPERVPGVAAGCGVVGRDLVHRVVAGREAPQHGDVAQPLLLGEVTGARASDVLVEHVVLLLQLLRLLLLIVNSTL